MEKNITVCIWCQFSQNLYMLTNIPEVFFSFFEEIDKMIQNAYKMEKTYNGQNNFEKE